MGAAVPCCWVGDGSHSEYLLKKLCLWRPGHNRDGKGQRKGVGGVGFVVDCRNNFTCCRKELKEKILIWILRTLYVRVKGVSAMAALGTKSIEIRNRILMMKMRQEERGRVRGRERAVNVCTCSTTIIKYNCTNSWNFQST